MPLRTMVERAPDLLHLLASELNVENAFAFLPHRRLILATPKNPIPGGKRAVYLDGLTYWITDPLTFCNAYVSVFTAAMGCAVPPMKANQQVGWLLSNEAKMAGWTELTGGAAKAVAIERAALGYPVVAAAVTQPHGHIAMMMPSPANDPKGAYVSAAGATNVVCGKLEKSFGALSALVRFFTHN